MQHYPDFLIKALVIENDRPGHIARHDGITVDDVVEVLSGDIVIIDAKDGRFRVIGPAADDTMWTVVIGPREAAGVYGLITARRASRPERRYYNEQMEGAT